MSLRAKREICTQHVAHSCFRKKGQANGIFNSFHSLWHFFSHSSFLSLPVVTSVFERLFSAALMEWGTFLGGGEGDQFVKILVCVCVSACILGVKSLKRFYRYCYASSTLTLVYFYIYQHFPPPVPYKCIIFVDRFIGSHSSLLSIREGMKIIGGREGADVWSNDLKFLAEQEMVLFLFPDLDFFMLSIESS